MSLAAVTVAGAQDQFVFREENRGDFDGAADEAAGVVSQVEDQPVELLSLEFPQRGAEFFGSMAGETFDLDIADMAGQAPDRVGGNRRAHDHRAGQPDGQRLRRGVAGVLQFHFAAFLPAGQVQTLLHREPGGGLAADFHDPVAGTQASLLRGRAGHYAGDEQRLVGGFDHFDSDADQFAGTLGIVFGELRRRFVAGIGIKLSGKSGQRVFKQSGVGGAVGIDVIFAQDFHCQCEYRRVGIGFVADFDLLRFGSRRRCGNRSGAMAAGRRQCDRQNSEKQKPEHPRLLPVECD